MKVTDPDACAATVVCSVWISWPSIVSVTGTFFSASSPLLLRPAVTVMRSWPENEARAKLTDGTARLAVFGDATETVFSVIDSPNRTSSDPLQPLRWKSLISTASRRLIGERLRMLSASLSAGPYRVAPDPTLAALTADVRRVRSEVARMFSSAFLLNRTSVARSSAPRPRTTVRAASFARVQ